MLPLYPSPFQFLSSSFDFFVSFSCCCSSCNVYTSYGNGILLWYIVWMDFFCPRFLVATNRVVVVVNILIIMCRYFIFLYKYYIASHCQIFMLFNKQSTLANRPISTAAVIVVVDSTAVAAAAFFILCTFNSNDNNVIIFEIFITFFRYLKSDWMKFYGILTNSWGENWSIPILSSIFIYPAQDIFQFIVFFLDSCQKEYNARSQNQ